MRRNERGRRRLAVLLTVCLLGIVGGSSLLADEGMDDAEERAYARAQLQRRARESVDPAHPAAGGLAEIKAAIEAKRADYAAIAPKELALADRMLGQGEDQGLIQLGAVLFRWIAGAAEGEQRVFLRDPAGRGKSVWVTATAEGKWRVYVPPASEQEPPAWIDLEAFVGERLEWQLRAALPTDPKVGIEGIEDLGRGGEEIPFALTDPHELETWICRPWLEAREKIVATRVQVFKAELPPRGLVSERTVRTKEARAAAFRKKAEDYKALREMTQQALDRMVGEEERLREDAGRLGFEIEEVRRAIEERKTRTPEAPVAKEGEPKEGEPKEGEPREGDPEEGPARDEGSLAEAERRLEELQLRELVGEQRLRLLYVAVRRAALRLELYEQAIGQAREEALAAEGAGKRYGAELSRMRREQQMAQLTYEEKRLEKRHEEAHAKARDEKIRNRPMWEAYDVALESLLALNAATREAVRLRRSLEARAKPEEEQPFIDPTVGPCAPPPARAGGQDAGPEATGAPAAQPQAKDPLEPFRRPRASILSAQYVNAATEQLDHPAWDGSLAAAHYEAVDDRVAALEEALESAGSASALEERFGRARKTAEDALQRVEDEALANEAGAARAGWRSRVWWDRDRILGPTIDAFRETLHGIREARTIMQEDVAEMRGYRARLLDLGARSFRVRTTRTLDGRRLGEAYDDAADTVGRALRWITLRGEDNAASFFGRNWLGLLLCVAALSASVVLVRGGRRTLDRVLRHLATRVPQLRTEPVTVRAEEAQARREKAVQEAAAKAAEEEALREVSKEEAARPQRMGEGGYSGGDDA